VIFSIHIVGFKFFQEKSVFVFGFSLVELCSRLSYLDPGVKLVVTVETLDCRDPLTVFLVEGGFCVGATPILAYADNATAGGPNDYL